MQKYYQILGLPPSATKEEVKKAYRALAKKYHPDVNSVNDTEQKFIEITTAYHAIIEEKSTGITKKKRQTTQSPSTPQAKHSKDTAKPDYTSQKYRDAQEKIKKKRAEEKRKFNEQDLKAKKEAFPVFLLLLFNLFGFTATVSLYLISFSLYGSLFFGCSALMLFYLTTRKKTHFGAEGFYALIYGGGIFHLILLINYFCATPLQDSSYRVSYKQSEGYIYVQQFGQQYYGSSLMKSYYPVRLIKKEVSEAIIHKGFLPFGILELKTEDE